MTMNTDKQRLRIMCGDHAFIIRGRYSYHITRCGIVSNITYPSVNDIYTISGMWIGHPSGVDDRNLNNIVFLSRSVA